jgi:hypothetical protein
MKNKLPAALILIGSVGVGTFFVAQTIFGANITSSVIVGNAAPTVSAVSVNGGSVITLTPGATTTVTVNASIADNNGCGDVTTGTTTILLYRSGVSSSTCLTTPNNQNCYVASAFTTQGTCSVTSMNTTTTFGVYYFAQATDASSSFSGQGWRATVIFRDPGAATGTADSSAVQLNTLTAINVPSPSINYSTVGAGSNTGATNQATTLANTGNSSTTLQISALATLTSGVNSIATSSQGYNATSFTYPGASTALSATPATVGSFALTTPTSTASVAGNIYWGLGIPAGTPAGSYTGTTVYSAVFAQ